MRPTSYSLGNNTSGTKQFNRIDGMNGVVGMDSNEMNLTLESLRMEVVESLRKDSMWTESNLVTLPRFSGPSSTWRNKSDLNGQAREVCSVF